MTYRRVTQLAAEILRTGKPPIRVTQVAAEIVRSAARPEMRVTQVAAEVLWTGRQSMRVTQLAAEVLRTAARPSTRVTQLAAEILWGGNSSMRVSQLALEVLRTGAPRMRVTQLALEALRTAVRPTMRVTQLALEILRLQGLAVTATLLPALFPPGTADPFRLRIAYLTDVLTARSGIEQRRQLRACPAGEMTWSTGPLSELEAQELAGLIYAGQAVGHMVPLWPFPRYLASDVVLHDSSLLLLPGPALFWWGMRAALVRPGHAEVYSIASIEDDPPTLHLSTAVTSSWPAGSSIFPIATGYLRPQQAQIWEALAIAGATLTFDIPSLGQLHAGGSPAPPEILGAEVLEVEPNRVGPVEDMNDRRLDLFDPRTGAVWIDAPSSAPRLARNFLWTILDEDQVLPLIAFLDRRRGQGLPFFVPSWQQDLTLASAVEAGADRITVERCGYSQQMWEIGASRRTIAIRSRAGSWSYHTVVSASAAAYEYLAISPPAPVAWPLGTLISFLRYGRLGRDDVELEVWRPGLLQAELPIRELVPPAFFETQLGYRLLWVHTFPDVTYSTFEITDLDPDDGHEDIVGLSGDNSIWVLDPATGETRYSYNPHSTRYQGSAYGHVCCADVNGDGKREIIWGSLDGWVRCMAHDLSAVLWTVDNWYDRQVPPIQAEEPRHYFENGPTWIRVSGTLYLYQTGHDGRLICIRASDGVIVHEVQLAGPVGVAPAIKDLDDAGGDPEILIVTDNRCDCYEPDLTLRWRVDENSTPSSDCTVFGAAVADINGDGELEVILSGGHWRNGIRETGLFVISKAGAVLCFTRLASSTWMRSLPTIYDIDGDQQLEIISNDDSGQIYCSRWNGGTGQLEVVWQKSLSSSPLNGSPLLLDVNGDGMREVLVPVAEGKVYVLRGSDGGILATIDHGYSTDIESVATGGDLNGDGKTEFLVPLTTVGRLLCYQGNNQTFAGNWFRRWGATPQRTGFVRDTDSG